MLSKCPSLHEEWIELFENQISHEKVHIGPLAQLKRALSVLGWKLADALTIQTQTEHIPLIQGNKDEEAKLDHKIREALRFHCWQQASKRSDMGGLHSDHGVDRSSTLALLSKLKGQERTHMLQLLTGCISTRPR